MNKDSSKAEKPNPFQRFFAFIGKDTLIPNESKKPIVVIRIIILSVMLYFTATLLVSHSVVSYDVVLFCLGFFLLFAGIFILSYRLATIYVLSAFYVSMIIWILSILHMFGWNVGVQHFLVLLLILVFFSFYQHYVFKTIQAGMLCLFRIILYFVYLEYDPILPLGSSDIDRLQMLNSVTIFWCIAITAFIFSKGSHEMEGKLVEYNTLLREQANTDTLTGLSNRRRALEYLEKLINEPVSVSGFSLCICDIDFFKKINDNYGHDCGDQVLVQLADLFRREIAGDGTAIRWGGEEFLLIFPNCNGDDACMILQRIREKIKALQFTHRDDVFGITMTFGLVEYDFRHDLKHALRAADQKLYFGKENGRDQIVF